MGDGYQCSQFGDHPPPRGEKLKDTSGYLNVIHENQLIA